MKKLFAILAVAGVLVACNDSGKQEEPKADSTANAAPAPDTTVAPVQDTTVKVDTTKAVDTAAAKH
ncbi:hypothetical protein [Pseudobacter ginsenosidimutans]|uniref:Lipoprotein n=1 Tax=Pseudobacter ginsenosidimutans TaxID=661488 RepID=A0A4Q7MCQ9_9BACT|nr:hypothetical protein [Pseudobacter ginsenosidimutans]QEC42662.1 hypothetical protein FSB84_13550 [Pseudobacter ginsenosidimutans]RZS65187.1 hypothetical protein EV199_5943 [Pseudobacter ginsenosidimutans]